MALSEAKKRYHADLGALQEQLAAQHGQKEILLAQQIQQLEEKLVTCLKDQDLKAGDGHGMGGANVERIQQLFQTTMSSLKKDVVAFVSLQTGQLAHPAFLHSPF